ncbi:unnamed protein product, partial [Prorocentrum cordatum]
MLTLFAVIADATETCPAEGCADVGARLWDQMGCRGCALSGAEVRQLPTGERGIFAARDLPQGHTVLSVPVELLVTVYRAAATPLGRAVLALHEEEPFGDLDGLLLTAWLLHEGALAESEFGAYLGSLPSSFPGLAFNFSEAEVHACAGGLAVEDYVLSRRKLLDAEFARLRALQEAGDLSLERFLRARFAVFSRTFTLSRMRLNFDVQMKMGKLWATSSKHGLGGDAGKDEAMALIPLADMINHAAGAGGNAKWKYEGLGSGFEIKTRRAITAGDELLLNYGDKGNDMLLAHYGFAVPGNRHDKLDLTLALGGAAGDGAAAHPLSLRGDRPADVETIEALLEACRAVAAARAGAGARRTPPEAEAAALRVLLGSLDEAAAPLRPPEGCPAACAVYRRSLLALLATWRVFAERALGLLEPGGGSGAWDASGAPEPHLLHARLYFGVWFRSRGKRLVVPERLGAELLRRAQDFGGVGYVDTLADVESADAHLLRCFGYFVRSSSVAFLDDLWEEIADGFIPCAICDSRGHCKAHCDPAFDWDMQPLASEVAGLTGSIGMGKSTVSKWFAQMGVPVNDADAVVHQLYAPGGAAVVPVRDLFGAEVVGEDGGIHRPAVVGEANSENLKKVEAIVFPLVDRARDAFIESATERGEPLVVLD